MALTEVYVDPSIAADSGAGTIGDPFGDLEYAIEQTTFDTTNGTRFNILAGTDEVLAASLENAINDSTTTPAYVPSVTAPLVFQGYTATAGDGGKGGISGGGSVSIIDGAVLDYVHFVDLHLHNCGAADIINIDDWCSVIRCELDNTTGQAIFNGNLLHVAECYIHNVGNYGIRCVEGVIENTIFANGSNKFVSAIFATGSTVIQRNIITLDSTSDGITWGGGILSNNSIFSDGGTGQGIVLSASKQGQAITNNIVEGFSGTGGIGFDLDAASNVVYYAGNSAYNNATDYADPVNAVIESGNETLSASGFTDALNNDFSPVDTGSISEGSVPSAFFTV